MDKINNINNIKPLNAFKQKQHSGIVTHPIPQDSFEKTDSTNTSKKKKFILALSIIVGLFGIYKGAKGLSKYLKIKTKKVPEKKTNLIEAPKNNIKDEIKVLIPTKIETPKQIETPKVTKFDTTQIKDAEIIEIKPKTITDAVEPITSSPAVKDVVETKTILATEKAKQLAEEYKQLIEKQDFINAHQIELKLNEEGFVIFNDKIVHKCSKEAFNPLRVAQTEDVSSVDEFSSYFQDCPIKCPKKIKTNNNRISNLDKPEKFGIENIGVSYYRGGQKNYFQEKTVLLTNPYGMSQDFPEGERVWVMGHDYLNNYKTRKKHYVTTLNFNESYKHNARPHGFVLSLEGDYNVETIEALKNRLIETGLANEFILAKTEAKEILDKIVDEVIAFMNKK